MRWGLNQADLRVHLLADIEQIESIVSCLSQDYMEFNEEAGEILINPNGEVAIKGLKSVYLIRQDSNKKSETTTAINDSLTYNSKIKSANSAGVTSKTNATIPATSSLWLKIILFIVLIMIFFLSMRYILKRFFD